MILEIFREKLDPQKINKVIEVSKDLELEPNWLLAVMHFETNKTFSPSITNPIGSVGLIQFTRDKKGVEYKTINGKKYFLSDLKKMSFIEQMDVVKEYYQEVYRMIKRKPQDFIDTYLVTFFPIAINKPLDFVFEAKGLSRYIIAKQNPAYRDKNGLVTKASVIKKFESYYGEIFKEINTKKKTS